MSKANALLVVGCWLLATGCATVPARQSVLSNENVREYAALLRMADSRTLDTLLIDRNFSSPSAELRALAARVIGQVGRARAAPRIPALRTLMRGTDTEVMAQAAYALGLLRDTAGVPDLVLGLRAPPVVAREAAWALGQIGNPARSSIVDALALWHTDPGTRVQLLLASAKLSPVPVASVVAHFNDENPSVIWAAAYAISRTRTAAGLNALWALGDSMEAHLPVRDESALLSDRQPVPYVRRDSAPYRIRAEIARMLTRAVTGDSLAPQAIVGLERYARDQHPHVRINAIRSLGSFGARARSIVIASLRDPDPNARVAAAQAIGAVRDSANLDWFALWDPDTSFAYRQALLESAMRHHAELSDFAVWSSHSDWRRRATVASAAGYGRTEEDRLRLARPLLADPDARVRAAAVSGVAPDTNALTPVVRALLTTASRDSDRQVRERALSRLSSRPESEDEPAAPVREMAWYVEVVRTIVAPTFDGRPLHVIVATERGPIGVEFFGAEAPLTVKNFLDLAKAGAYRGTRFHRVVPNFVAQDGDPRGDGSGGPGYSIRDELNNHRYDRGVLGMALSGPDTGGSQWFITHSPQPHLDGGYTVFGRVVSGFDALDRIVQGDLLIDVR